MTLSSQTSKNVYVGNDSTLVFAYTFRIFQDSDLEVTIQDTSVDPQTEITLVLDSDYTVSGADNPTGGNVTLVLGGQLSAPPTTTDNITIRRNLPLTQPTDYVENDPFPADSHEDALDRSRMIDQQIQEEVDRSLKLPVNITGVDVSLPVPEAGAPIGWNDTATGLTNNPDMTNLSQIDSAANPDYIGAAAGDGVLRTSGLLTYTDGGDYVTIGITNAAIDHDQLTNFVANEHLPAIDEDDMISDSDTAVPTQQSVKKYVDDSVALVNEFVELTDTPAAYAGSAGYIVRVNATPDGLEFGPESAIDHDGLTNFVADEHVAHSTVSISAGGILSGGGTIDANQTITLAHGDVDHDQTLNFVADEHVAHSSVTLSAGAGLSGGGDITANRSFAVDINSEVDTVITASDEILFSDVSDSNNIKKDTVQGILDLVGAGASTFIGLTDTPGSYASQSLKAVRVNAGETALEFYTPSGGGATLTQDVAQATHGFSVGDWIYHNGTIYALADASAAGTAESIGVVSSVTDANNFTVQFGGRITGLSGLTAGEAHFLSETAGAITATAPSTEGAVIKPVLIADSTTTGFIFNMRGVEVTSTTSFYLSFTNADLSSGILTLSHNLGHKYCQVQIFNNSDKLIMPDDITLTDNDTATVDLTSFGTITGTWHAVVLDVGTTSAYTNTSFLQDFVNGDLSSGVLSVSHAMGTRGVIVQVYDNNYDLVQPDDITATDTDTVDIDLTSYGTLTGTWKAVIVAAGATAVSSTATDLQLAGQTTGDLAVFNGSNWVRLAPGTSGNILTSNGAASQPTYQAPSAPTVTCQFRARAAGTQTNLAVSSNVLIQLPNETTDVGGDFDASSTYLFTAPVTGYYQINANLRMRNLDTAAACELKLICSNGAKTPINCAKDVRYLTGDPAGDWSFFIGVSLQLAASETLGMYFFQNGGTAQADVDGAEFSGHLIGT